jgi:hypothetical protein
VRTEPAKGNKTLGGAKNMLMMPRHFRQCIKRKMKKKKKNTNPTSSLSVDKESSLAATKEISDKSANSDAAAAWQQNFYQDIQ